MRKFIYLSIVDKLKEIKDDNGQPVIRHFDLWNNNLEYTDDEQPFYTPAIFVEFMPIEWRHQGSGVREAVVTVALHVVTQRNAPASNQQPYEEHALRFFDLLTDINRCLHGRAKTGYNFGYDALTSVQSTTDNNSEELRHDIEVFACHVQDASAMPVRKTTTAKPVIKI